MKILKNYKEVKAKYPDYLVLFKTKNNVAIAVKEDKEILIKAIGQAYFYLDYSEQYFSIIVKKVGKVLTVESIKD